MPNRNWEKEVTPDRDPAGAKDMCNYQKVGGKDLKYIVPSGVGEEQPITIKETTGLPITPVEQIIPDK